MSARIAASWVVVLFLACAASAQDFSGAYAGDGLTLLLRRDAQDADDYTGMIALGAKRFRAAGHYDRVKGFHGTFDADGNPFAWSMRPEGDGFVLTSGDAKYNLKRAGEAPPVAGGGGGGGGGGDGMPAFLKPGLRITYMTGALASGGTLLKPDPQGLIEDKQKNKYRLSETRAAGGIGYTNLNVVRADAQVVAADVRNYLLVDIQNDVSAISSNAALVGSGEQLDDYWVHPARLAAMRPGVDPRGIRVRRGPYATLRGQRYEDAVSIEASIKGYSSHTYDAQTGLLIFGGRCDIDPGFIVKGPNGDAIYQGNGERSHAELLSVRQVDVPWANDGAPAWVAEGRVLEYQGGTRAIVRGGEGLPPLPPRAAAMSITFGRGGGGMFGATQVTELDNGPGIPRTPTSTNRCFASAQLMGAWVSPRAVQGLRQGQVIDEDRHTKFRTTFAGVQNGAAVFVEQGPRDTQEAYYDLNNGMLVGVRHTTMAPNIGQMLTEFRFVGMK